MIGKWSTNNAMVPKSYEDFLTLTHFWAEQWRKRKVLFKFHMQLAIIRGDGHMMVSQAVRQCGRVSSV